MKISEVLYNNIYHGIGYDNNFANEMRAYALELDLMIVSKRLVLFSQTSLVSDVVCKALIEAIARQVNFIFDNRDNNIAKTKELYSLLRGEEFEDCSNFLSIIGDSELINFFRLIQVVAINKSDIENLLGQDVSLSRFIGIVFLCKLNFNQAALLNYMNDGSLDIKISFEIIQKGLFEKYDIELDAESIKRNQSIDVLAGEFGSSIRSRTPSSTSLEDDGFKIIPRVSTPMPSK
jgi:hypothetical protein